MPGSSSDLSANDVENGDVEDDEEEEEATKVRKKLGMPEYDPDEALLTALPKILILDWKQIVFSHRCRAPK